MAAGKCCFIHHIEQSNPSVPLLASEGNFAVEVCDLPPGVNKLNFLSNQQLTKRNVMSSRNVSRGRVPACDDQS